MENLKVAYDGTVRDANNNILQFQYGDDGVDAVHIVRLAIPTVCDKWDITQIDLSLHPLLQAERERTLQSHLYMQAWSKQHNETLVSCPIDVAVLYERARMLSGNTFKHESLGTILEKVQTLLSIIDIDLFRHFLVLFLQAKNLVKLSATFFAWLLDTIKERFEQCKIHPGEMVGVSFFINSCTVIYVLIHCVLSIHRFFLGSQSLSKCCD